MGGGYDASYLTWGSFAAEPFRTLSHAKAGHIWQSNTKQPKMATKKDWNPEVEQPDSISRFKPEEEAVEDFSTMYTSLLY